MKQILNGLVISITSFLLSIGVTMFSLFISALIIKHFSVKSDLGISITIIIPISITSALVIYKNIKDIIKIKKR